ncbi:MAG: hypothetical protein J3R72DRAFT_447629 [Linnemannia gamsii]|nr:MAG: hypothetical protein J3R72DRAFT_447629 [Linnemannia gamsii]
MEAVVKGCWMLKAVVVANVVIGSEGEFGGSGGVGNSSRASSSNHSLMLTHKTLDFLTMTCPPRTSNQDKEATSGTIKTQRKLHTLNLANGLRFPQPPPTTTDPSSTSTISTPPSPHTLSLSTLLLTHSLTLTTVNLSFCGPAVTDSCISNFSPSLLSLNIAFCYEVTDVGLVTLAHTSPGLLHLDITGVTQVSDKGILEIGYRCQGFRTLVMVDERYRSNAGGTVVGTGGGHGGQWCTQNPWITDQVLRIFSWGAQIIQRRDELLGQKRSPRIF